MAPTKPNRTKGPNKAPNKLNATTGTAAKTSAPSTSSASAAVNGKNKKGTNGNGNGIQKKEDGNVDELRNAIRALGGGDEDYALVKSLDADSEEEQEFDGVAANAKMTKEINDFMKKLDFKSVTSAVVVQDEEPSSSSDAEDEEDEDDSEETKVDQSTSTSAPAPAPGPSEEAKAIKRQLAAAKLNIPPSAHWYSTPLPPLSPTSTPLPAVSPSTLSSLLSRASSLHSSLPPPPSTSKSDEAFIRNVLSSGTLSDRLSALTLLAQASPIHNMKALESLRAMSGKKGREGSLKALRAVCDWWVGGGGPGRKLKYFADQPLNHPDVTDTHLIMWYFEDWLKKYFFNILQILESLTQDPLPYTRLQSLNLLSSLLSSKPEQEQNILRIIVNKLGDGEKSVASKASYHLGQVVQEHPGMKAVVVREISELVFKAGTKPSAVEKAKGGQKGKAKEHPGVQDGTNIHARYYSVITLNQMTLSSQTPADQAVAGQLIDLYFQLFRDMLHEDPKGKGVDGLGGEADGEMGVETDGKKDSKGNLRIRGPFPGPGKGKSKAPAPASDAFTETESTSSRTLSAILTGVNRAMPFARPDDETIERHVDTLFRITHTATFNVSVQALGLIGLMREGKEAISNRFYRTLYESILDPRLITSSKQALWLNLTFKAIKSDKSFARVAAFVKRILQGLNMHQPGFICGVLYMIGQVMDQTPRLRELIKPRRSSKTKSSKDDESTAEKEEYDPRKRDPQFAHAETTYLWEIIPLLHHFHPSVSLHASQLLSASTITATPDLALNTLSHFLDRFVYKNPKKPKPRGGSAMQPAAAASGEGVHFVRGGMAGLTIGGGGTVNEAGFWKMRAEQVPVDQLFFHKFFLNKLDKQKVKDKKLAKKKKAGSDEDESGSDDAEVDVASDDDDEAEDGSGASGSEVEVEADDAEDGEDDGSGSDSDDPDEAEIWKAMQQTMPGPKVDLDMMDDDDSDSIPSGLDDSDSDGLEDDDAVLEEDLDADEEALEEDSDADGHIPDDSSSGSEVDFAEDADDIVASDDEVLIPSAFEPEDSEAVSGKRKPSAEDTQKGGRKKRRIGALPTFASYEDYAKLIEEAPEEDL